MKASIGRIVLYQCPGSPGGEFWATTLPAIITKVKDKETQKCELFVINSNGVYFKAVPYSEELSPGHWSWMPYQKQQEKGV